ncbi:MAG: hydroxymethylglutaryl-CoA lyase [Candidatus Xenobia bacterium]
MIRIVEVGPRDGLQNEPETVSVADRVGFIERLLAAGETAIEAGAFVHPKWVPQMASTDELWPLLPQKPGVTYAALVPNARGLERARGCGVKRIAIFGAASESFTKRNINSTIAESLQTFKAVVQEALALGMTVRGYVSTVFVCPYEGDVAPRAALEVTENMLEMGCDEISLGDTIGAAVPKMVDETVGLILQHVPVDRLALHFHDTYGTALANVMAGLALGIRTFDASAGGLGGCPYAPGASGNLATEDLVYLLTRSGLPCGIDLDRLAEASFFMEGVLGRRLPSRQLQRLRARTRLEA